jgi:hypothetical protein
MSFTIELAVAPASDRALVDDNVIGGVHVHVQVDVKVNGQITRTQH